MAKVRVNEDACTGHGRCYVLCPEVFREDTAGYCEIGQPQVPTPLEGKARTAADNCPERAIHIEE